MKGHGKDYSLLRRKGGSFQDLMDITTGPPGGALGRARRTGCGAAYFLSGGGNADRSPDRNKARSLPHGAAHRKRLGPVSDASCNARGQYGGARDGLGKEEPECGAPGKHRKVSSLKVDAGLSSVLDQPFSF